MRLRVLVMCTVMVMGCYGPIDIAYHEPARYKGSEDPLLNRERLPQQQQVLLERFKTGQLDR